MIQNYYTSEYLEFNEELQKVITVEIGEKYLDWGKPGLQVTKKAKCRLCEEKDFSSSKYLKKQWMMFHERHPMCVEDDQGILLEGGLASTETKAFTINIKKC